MSTTLNVTCAINTGVRLTDTAKAMSPGAGYTSRKNLALVQGTAAGQSDRLVVFHQTIAAGDTLAIDLYALTDDLGNAISFHHVKFLEVSNDGDDVSLPVAQILSTSGSNPWTNLDGAVSATHNVEQGGTFLVSNPQVGIVVSATNRLLQIKNLGLGSAVLTVEVLVVGTSV